MKSTKLTAVMGVTARNELDINSRSGGPDNLRPAVEDPLEAALRAFFAFGR